MANNINYIYRRRQNVCSSQSLHMNFFKVETAAAMQVTCEHFTTRRVNPLSSSRFLRYCA